MKARILLLLFIQIIFHNVWANSCPQNNFYAKKPDGCSSWSNNPKQFRDKWGSVDFTSACMTHDRCYYTLGTSESSCNNAFLNNLLTACKKGLRICKKITGKKYCSPPEPITYTACASFSTGMYTIVRGASRSVYRKAQKAQRQHENKCNTNTVNKTIAAGNFKFDGRDPIYYSNGQGHYCWFNSMKKFIQLTNGKWKVQSGKLSKYKMEYDGICTGGPSSPAAHPDPRF